MDARQPEQVSKTLVSLLDKGAVEGIADLYEDDAIFSDFDHTEDGLNEILEAYRRFCDGGKTLLLGDSAVLQVDDIALVHWSWTVRDADGSSRKGVSAEVLRRQPGGDWKFIIDNSDVPSWRNGDA